MVVQRRRKCSHSAGKRLYRADIVFGELAASSSARDSKPLRQAMHGGISLVKQDQKQRNRRQRLMTLPEIPHATVDKLARPLVRILAF